MKTEQGMPFVGRNTLAKFTITNGLKNPKEEDPDTKPITLEVDDDSGYKVLD